MDKTTKLVSRATAVSVGLVAIFAAVISYYHIIHIGYTHGEFGVASPFTALSIDGTILASSLMLLYCSWHKLDVPWLARVMLWLGVGATLACNIGYGADYGAVGALYSSWPAIAFAGTVETVLQLGKIKRRGNRVDTQEIMPDGRTLEEVKADYDRKKHGPIEVIEPAIAPNVIRAEAGLTELPKQDQVNYGDPDVRNVPSKKSVKASAYYDITHKLPTIQSIQDELGCTQYKARKIWLAMRDEHCDMAKAILIVDEAKNGAKDKKADLPYPRH